LIPQFKFMIRYLTRPTKLGHITRQLEKSTSPIIADDAYAIIRLDGCSFRKYTFNIQKPFDYPFQQTMTETAEHLMKKFGAITAFTQSDEITLVLPKGRKPYNGRCQKLSSVAASHATMYFNSRTMYERDATFDARTFPCTPEEAIQAVYWRHKHDLRRNAYNQIVTTELGHSKVQSMSIHQRKRQIKTHHDKLFLFGTWLKWCIVLRQGRDPIKNIKTTTKQRKLSRLVFNMRELDVNFILARSL